MALHGYNWTIIFALLCFAWSIIIIFKIAFLPFMCLKAIQYILKGLVKKIQAAHSPILFMVGKIKNYPLSLTTGSRKSRSLSAGRKEHVRDTFF